MNLQYITDAPFIQQCKEVMLKGYQNGWHELNGGNISYRIKEEEIEQIKSFFTENKQWITLKSPVLELKNEYFLVSGSGRYFKNVEERLEETIGIIQIDEKGENYRICWGLEDSKPTSELPTHLLNHQVKKNITNNSHRVIYHAHTTNIISLTFVLPLDGVSFTRELWEMATECPVVFPEGIGVVPWMVPGGAEIGIKSSELMEKHNIVVWAHHGTFCSGISFEQTLGLMETVEKAAEILVKVLSMTSAKRQTIEPHEFNELAKAFKIKLDDKYLYSK